jgi:hypothetical protein
LLLELFRREKIRSVVCSCAHSYHKCFQFASGTNFLNGGNPYRPFRLARRVIATEFATESIERGSYLEDMEMGLTDSSQRIASELHLESARQICDMFYVACARGQLRAAMWLGVYYNITADIARSYGNFALRLACVGGYLSVAHWLVDHFRLTVRDVRARNYVVWRIATTRGHTPMVAWLVLCFGPPVAKSLSIDIMFKNMRI